ncbi:E7 protein [Iotapapillomavirus 1]|uniref:Protein E7 n=1 Tax=Mastomys natalensis papillomavirus (isolate African multimammate rat) TaxID=654915 RepID=Q84355_MNPVA|nr:E7 protein [Iotapapillomavirus 1]AAA67145.1 E7 protein [Iotapapillomavirus 1]
MIGPDTTRCLTGETPDSVSLYCHEVLDEDELKEPTEAAPPPEQYTLYQVLIECPECNKTIRLTCAAQAHQIRGLEHLLLDGLRVICPRCNQKNGRS